LLLAALLECMAKKEEKKKKKRVKLFAVFLQNIDLSKSI
jgi:hypothetical protein